MDIDPKLAPVWRLVEPIALEAGLEVVDIEYRREGRGPVLRLLLDRPGGISLDQLSAFSRQVSDVLDVHPEDTPGSYTLEVSSPGINRPLRRPAHFLAFVGKRVHVRTRAPVGDRHTFRGVLESVDDGGIVIRSDDGGRHAISFAAILHANYQHEFSSPAHAGGRGRRTDRQAGGASRR